MNGRSTALLLIAVALAGYGAPGVRRCSASQGPVSRRGVSAPASLLAFLDAAAEHAAPRTGARSQASLRARRGACRTRCGLPARCYW
jgi:hypothetical protein